MTARTPPIPANDHAAGHGPPPERLLAELHAARQLAREDVAAHGEGASWIDPRALWRHVRRAPGAPVDLATVRLLRESEAARARYGAMMASVASAHSPVALAASDGAVTRRVGDAVLEMLPAEDGAPALLVLRVADPAPAALELLGEAGALRLALPRPEDGTITIALEGEAEGAAALLADPRTAIYLLAP